MKLKRLEPTYRFNLTGLLPNRRYEFNLRFIAWRSLKLQCLMRSGSLVTYPPEGVPWAIYICIWFMRQNLTKQTAQGSWTAIKGFSEITIN